jgi:cytoskeleton protein RodZ
MASGTGPLQLSTTQASWIEVQDARGATLLSRTVEPGEKLGLDGSLPLRLTIGNASATQLSFRGQPVDLAPRTRDNVARLELR